MLIACWSSKGGSGTTVVAAALAAVLGAGTPTGALLVDLEGDAAAALGVVEPPNPGVHGWLAAGESVPADALARLEVAVAPGLRLLGPGPAGPGPWPPGRAGVLAALLAADPRPVVVDCGMARGPLADAVLAASTRSLLVLRPCYLALRRAQPRVARATGLVVLDEEERALGPAEVGDALGRPVVAVVPVCPSVARAVDAGLLAARLPRPLVRSLRRVS